MIKRLRIRFILIFMLLTSLIIALSFVSILIRTMTQMAADDFEMMELLAKHPTEDVKLDGIQLPYFIVECNSADVVLKVSGGRGTTNRVDLENISHLIREINADDSPSGLSSDKSLRFLKTASDGKNIYIFLDISSKHATIQRLSNLMLIIGTLLLCVFFAISIILSYWATKPIAIAWNQQKHFIADASHELKTPLTVLMTNAEMLQEPSCTAEMACQLRSNILVTSKQMRGLVEGLLQLARLDQEHTPAKTEYVNLSNIVSSSLLPFEPVFFEKGLTLRADIQGEIFVRGVSSQLRQLIDILLDNAQKYSNECGTTKVSLKNSGTRCILTVSNEGAPIPAKDLRNIFGRFYRVDKVRSNNQGYGLGLAIGLKIVEEHKGKIHAESYEGVNYFIVSLPTT